MSDWTEELNQFLGDKGTRQSVPELDQSDESLIQELLNEVVKPAFAKIKQELDLYPNLKAEIYISKKPADSVMEQVEFRVYRIMQNKFTYRLRFSKVDKEIRSNGQFCIPNLYGESINFTDTSFSKLINQLTVDNIAEDFTKAFKENFGKK